MKDKLKHNFLILGVARSGTTLLQKLLDSHSQIAVCPESNVFTSLYRTTWRGRFVSVRHYQQFMIYLKAWLINFSDPAFASVTDFFAKNESFKGSVKSLLDQLVSNYLEQKDKSIFGEKTPQNLYHIPLIRRICPDVKLIVLWRHPYDIICSVAKLLANNTKQQEGRLTNDVLLQAAVFVKWGFQSLATDQLNDFSIIQLKYEAILDDPITELKRVCHFLTLDFEATMLSFQTDDLLRDQEKMAYLHPNLSNKIDAGNRNKYLGLINDHQQQLLYRFLGETIKGIPYQIVDNQAGLSFAQRGVLFKYQFLFFIRKHQWKDGVIRLKLLIKHLFYN